MQRWWWLLRGGGVLLKVPIGAHTSQHMMELIWFRSVNRVEKWVCSWVIDICDRIGRRSSINQPQPVRCQVDAVCLSVQGWFDYKARTTGGLKSAVFTIDIGIFAYKSWEKPLPSEVYISNRKVGPLLSFVAVQISYLFSKELCVSRFSIVLS